MKKSIYLTIIKSILLCTVVLTACSKNDDNSIPVEPKIKFVKNITYGESSGNDEWDYMSITLMYDLENKMKSLIISYKAEEDEEPEITEMTIQYEKDKGILKDNAGNDFTEILLTPLGYAKSFDDYEFFYNEEGFLQQTNYENKVENKYSWEEGDITRIIRQDDNPNTDFTQINYSTYKNNANIDLNTFAMAILEGNGDELITYRILNLLGKSSKNLIESASYYDKGEEGGSTTFSYAFDKEGYPVKCSIKEEGKEGATVTIEYIN